MSSKTLLLQVSGKLFLHCVPKRHQRRSFFIGGYSPITPAPSHPRWIDILVRPACAAMATGLRFENGVNPAELKPIHRQEGYRFREL